MKKKDRNTFEDEQVEMREEAQSCHLEDEDNLENTRKEGSEKNRPEGDEISAKPCRGSRESRLTRNHTNSRRRSRHS